MGKALNIRAQSDIENLLRTDVKPNAEYKEALRARLFRGPRRLGPDDLEKVTGGVTQESLWESWEFGDERG